MNLRSKGKDNGTYIRVAGTSRQAFPEKIKELEMEGARISWDELTCVGYPVSEEISHFLKHNVRYSREQIVQCFWIRENLQDRFIHKSKKQ